MAIASFVLHTIPAGLERTLAALQARQGILAAQKATEDRIAATAELAALELPLCLQDCKNLPDVIDLELVYVNYEDDLDGEGQIAGGSLAELRGKLGIKS